MKWIQSRKYTDFESSRCMVIFFFYVFSLKNKPVFKVIRHDQKTSHRGSIQFHPSGSGRTLNPLRKTKSRNSFVWTQSRASYFLHVELTSNNQIHVRYSNRPFQWGRFCTLHPSLIFVCLKPIRKSGIDHNTHNKKNTFRTHFRMNPLFRSIILTAVFTVFLTNAQPIEMEELNRQTRDAESTMETGNDILQLLMGILRVVSSILGMVSGNDD